MADPINTPSNGDPAQGAPAGAPSSEQAQGAATPTAADVAAAEKRGRDAAFAELRRNGALKKSALQALDSANKPTAASDGAAGTSVDLRHLDRAVTRTGLGSNLSDAAYKRLERAYAEERPDDSEAWVKDYFEGMGVAKPTTSTTNIDPKKPAAPQNTLPITDVGAPSRSQTPLDQQDVLSMTEQDVAAFVKTKGHSAFKRLMETQLRNNGTRFKLLT